MKYWLMKSEPNVWSIKQQKKVGAKGATWDGVRNHQAANNLKSRAMPCAIHLLIIISFNQHF